MGNTLIRDGLIFSLLVGGGLYGFTHRPMIYDLLDMEQPGATQAPINEEAPEQSAASVTNISGSVASVRKESDGHFWAEARVNSTHIRFLVDTGASVVALTPNDAKKAGFKPTNLVYNVPISTAGGRVMAARVTLKYVAVGNVSVSNVQAVIIPEGLSHSLLGMSYLGKLQKVEATSHALILRR